MVKETALLTVCTICSSGCRPLFPLTFSETCALLLQKRFLKVCLKTANITAWAQFTKCVAAVLGVLLAPVAHLAPLARTKRSV